MASNKIMLYPINHAKCFFSLFFIVQSIWSCRGCFCVISKIAYCLYLFCFVFIPQFQLIVSADHELQRRDNIQKHRGHNVNMIVGSLFGRSVASDEVGLKNFVRCENKGPVTVNASIFVILPRIYSIDDTRDIRNKLFIWFNGTNSNRI